MIIKYLADGSRSFYELYYVSVLAREMSVLERVK